MNNIEGRRWREGACLFFTGIAVVVMMTVIFHFSSQNADRSSGLSEGICMRLLVFFQQVLGKDFSIDQLEGYIDILETPIRKGAHFTEYMIFSYLTCLHGLSWRIFLEKKKVLFVKVRDAARGFWPMLLKTILFCILYAASDEFHQLFVEGRAGRILDVGVDSMGILCGAILFLLTVRSQKVRIFMKWIKHME
ncbi:MAG: VanZ family protein [Clostridiales bacterium]|nr:VanZ family protein [Clostridiales bacterium]